MITSKKLTSERLAEIKSFPITYDDDCPELTSEQIARMYPRNAASSGQPMVTVTLHIPSDIYHWYQSHSDNYEASINAALRREMALA
jgi:uncharacterized protein (DUF4415 family)